MLKHVYEEQEHCPEETGSVPVLSFSCNFFISYHIQIIRHFNVFNTILSWFILKFCVSKLDEQHNNLVI